MRRNSRHLLAVASGGGHWVQLRSLREAFEDCEVTWVTVRSAYSEEVEPDPLVVVPDATRWDKFAIIKLAFRMAWVVIRTWPDTIVTTGALPGLLALVFGKLIRSRTIWIDSVANADELSGSGAQAKRFADLWLTQWSHLARPGGPRYEGSVL